MTVTCDVCQDAALVPASWALAREPVCTCGTGPFSELALHDIACDTVPCPFCPLLGELAFQEA